MSDKDVQFNIDDGSQLQLAQKTPTMVRLAMKYSGGLVKNETQANYVLLGLAVVAFTVSLVLFSG